jgi:HD-GYP domain-containing protein (c-di-GMP phosphodiesterase class II)
MKQENLILLSLDSVQPNAICQSDIRDDDGGLLLGARQPLTDSVRQALRQRQVFSVRVSERDAEALRGKSKSLVSKRAVSGNSKPNETQIHRASHGSKPLDSELAKYYRSQVTSAVAAIYKSTMGVSQIEGTELAELCQIPTSLIEMLCEDSDQILSMTTCCQDSKFALAQRCVNFSVLTVSTAIELGLDHAKCLTLGIAALFHDFSLFSGPLCFRVPGMMMTDEEAWQYSNHPRKSAELIAQSLISMPEVCELIRQVHEKPDGTGYPRGITQVAFHPLSRILHLIDAYLRLTEPGPGQPPLRPHDAVKVLINEAQRGKLEEGIVHAFVNQLSYFPIGSCVKLGDGRIGHVIRRGQKGPKLPLIQIEGETDPYQLSEQEPTVFIAQAFSNQPHLILDDQTIQELSLDWFN